ncbi:MAG: acyloxyacyl hydrolase, partial [Bacteroidota bacterium]
MNSQRFIQFLIILIYLGGATLAVGQNGLYLEASFHAGKLIRHTPKFDFSTQGTTIGFDVNLNFQTYGKKDWHQWRNFPSFGVRLLRLRLRTERFLGLTLACAPNLTIPLSRKRNWNYFYQIGAGVALMTRRYDATENPTNNAIGSNLVATILMKWYLTRQINPNWKITAGLGMNHFSNGGTRLPNLGLNIPSLSLGVNYYPRQSQPRDFIFSDKSKKTSRKLGWEIQTGIAWSQRFFIGGPRHPVYIFNLGMNYYLNRVNRLVGGIEYEQNRVVYNFVLLNDPTLSNQEALKKGSRVTLFLGDEFFYGNFSILLRAGIYLGDFSDFVAGRVSTQ